MQHPAILFCHWIRSPVDLAQPYVTPSVDSGVNPKIVSGRIGQTQLRRSLE
jgi:hypothetical protein